MLCSLEAILEDEEPHWSSSSLEFVSASLLGSPSPNPKPCPSSVSDEMAKTPWYGAKEELTLDLSFVSKSPWYGAKGAESTPNSSCDSSHSESPLLAREDHS